MTPNERLDEIRARLAAIAPGEWRVVKFPPVNGIRNWHVHDNEGRTIADTGWEAAPNSDTDADFIAHAPADIRYLLDLLDA